MIAGTLAAVLFAVSGLHVYRAIGGTAFVRRDTWVYSPLCLALAVAFARPSVCQQTVSITTGSRVRVHSADSASVGTVAALSDPSVNLSASVDSVPRLKRSWSSETLR